MSVLLPLERSCRQAGVCVAKSVALAFLLITVAFAADVTPPSSTQPTAGDPSSLYLKVQLEHSVKMSSLRPGDVLRGSLSEDVYSGNHKLFPYGSNVRLTVDKLERRKRRPNDHWPWIVRVFMPRHENSPLFDSAVITLPDGHSVPLDVSLISLGPKVEVRAVRKDRKGATSANSPETANAEQKKAAKKQEPPVITLEGSAASVASLMTEQPGDLDANARPLDLGPGLQAKVILLDDLSAGKNRTGDHFHARLIQPLYSGSTLILPAGSIFDGEVLKSTQPRWLSRAGSIYLKFTGVDLDGRTVPVAATVSQAEVNEGSHTVLDPEGQLKGGKPGKLWMLANIGASSAMAKAADDGTQLLIEAISSTATDASTAGVAKIAAAAASGIMMITRHGRDVILPRFTEMNIVFDRP